jgi:hypothetical protein
MFHFARTIEEDGVWIVDTTEERLDITGAMY